MRKEIQKRRNISILDFFEKLQEEYLLYELRTKIYPSKIDKDKYHEVLDYKQEKIEDIADKNELLSIFNSDVKREEVEKRFYNEFGNPLGLSGRDKYFYYFLGSDFSYRGRGVKLVSYDLENGKAIIKRGDDDEEVDINEIKRIL